MFVAFIEEVRDVHNLALPLTEYLLHVEFVVHHEGNHILILWVTDLIFAIGYEQSLFVNFVWFDNQFWIDSVPIEIAQLLEFGFGARGVAHLHHVTFKTKNVLESHGALLWLQFTGLIIIQCHHKMTFAMRGHYPWHEECA